MSEGTKEERAARAVVPLTHPPPSTNHLPPKFPFPKIELFDCTSRDHFSPQTSLHNSLAMADDLETRLQSHAKAFDGLMSLIPAKYYYGEDNDVSLDL